MKRGQGEKCCKITRARNFLIPAQTEKFIEIDVARTGDPIYEGILEPTASLVRSGLLMARSIVKVHNGKVKVRLLNVHDQPITLQKNRPIGLLHPLSRLAAVIKPVEKKEDEDFDKIYNKDDLPEHLHPILDGADLDTEQ